MIGKKEIKRLKYFSEDGTLLYIITENKDNGTWYIYETSNGENNLKKIGNADSPIKLEKIYFKFAKTIDKTG